MKPVSINVTPKFGHEYLVEIPVPSNLESYDLWKYICKWVDENLNNVKEWKQ